MDSQDLQSGQPAYVPKREAAQRLGCEVQDLDTAIAQGVITPRIQEGQEAIAFGDLETKLRPWLQTQARAGAGSAASGGGLVSS